ncbi:MAG: hypothetical protein GY794_06340 [bacterium]|nr:hypothetical protein [bacterium]
MTVREYVTMDGRIKSLIAVGAAAAVNCRPSLECHVSWCIKAGVSEDDAREAIEIGFQVNRSAHAKTKGYVKDVITDTRQDIGGSRSECCDEETGTKTGCCRASTQSRGRGRS